MKKKIAVMLSAILVVCGLHNVTGEMAQTSYAKDAWQAGNQATVGAVSGDVVVGATKDAVVSGDAVTGDAVTGEGITPGPVVSGDAVTGDAITGDAVEKDEINMDRLLNMDELYGWATVPGEGMNGITGGGKATPQIVTTLAELTELAGDDVPRVLVIDGTIKCGGYGVLVGKNKTIVGMNSEATVYGGFRIHDSNNVIISNMNIQGTWPNSGPDDCLEIKRSHHVWLNHLNIWDSTDGNVDITLGSDYITVSWCKMWYSEEADNGVAPEQDHRLSCLVGSGAGDHDDTDMDKLRVTFHHNWFADRIDQRMPRVMYGRTHVYNNYYSSKNNKYCVGADSYASVLIENNYFNNVNNPHEFSYYPGFPASITARGNIYDKTTGTQTVGQHQTAASVVPFETTVYDYYLNAASDVPVIVQAYAGPQDMLDESAVPEELKNGAIVEGVEQEEPEPTLPDVSPVPTLKPTNTFNDNPITYDESTDTYTYHGQNSDGSHAYYTIDNPYAGYDFSEGLEYEEVNGVMRPAWKRGATISYWVKMPSNAIDAAILNFNLENERQMERNDQVKYEICQAYNEDDALYYMGEMMTFVDENGLEYDVLNGWYGPYVLYNPNYPAEGCYTINDEGGAIRAYKKGTDPSDENNWYYLEYIGKGLYQDYGRRFDEEGGHTSKIREAQVSGSLSLYASSSVGYRQDNWHALQMNPYLKSYGQVQDVQQYNQFYYWGNGGYECLDDNFIVPTVGEKEEWHFVVAVIQNDWIQYYVDGIEIDFDYLNWWDQPLVVHAGSKSFNLGHGHKKIYRPTEYPSAADSVGMTILEFISDEDTVLTVGGLGAGATRLGQENMGTPNGVQVKDIQFYFVPVTADCIRADKIVLGGEEDTTPTVPSTPPAVTPGAVYMEGDVDNSGQIQLRDAQLALRAALLLDELSLAAKEAADVTGDGKVELRDAQLILRRSLLLIEDFEQIE